MIKKDYFNTSHVVISQDNVQRIGELISLKALKMLCQFNQKAFVKLYKGLIQDVYYPTTTFSDGYDTRRINRFVPFFCSVTKRAIISRKKPRF